MRKSVALAVVGVACSAMFTGVTTSARAAAACGSQAPGDKDYSAYVTVSGSPYIYNGASQDCNRVALMGASDRADYYCYTVNPGSGATWTFLRDVTSGWVGWVRDDKLPGYGSAISC